MANSHWCWSKILLLTAILFLAIQFMPQLLPINTSENLLDDCYHVYLDMGTNTGVQVMNHVCVISSIKTYILYISIYILCILHIHFIDQKAVPATSFWDEGQLKYQGIT